MIRQNLSKLINSKIVQDLLKYILGQVVKRWVGDNVLGRGPGETMTLEEIEDELKKDRPFEEVARTSDALGGAQGGPKPLSEDRGLAHTLRAHQYTDWYDGGLFAWIGREKRPGRGEGSSGLRFDVVELG